MYSFLHSTRSVRQKYCSCIPSWGEEGIYRCEIPDSMKLGTIPPPLQKLEIRWMKIMWPKAEQVYCEVYIAINIFKFLAQNKQQRLCPYSQTV